MGNFFVELQKITFKATHIKIAGNRDLQLMIRGNSVSNFSLRLATV